MPSKCVSCGADIDLFRGVESVDVETGKVETWHWRCYHVEADTLACEDGSHRKMTFDEWRQHQKWADDHHDGRGNQKSST